MIRGKVYCARCGQKMGAVDGQGVQSCSGCAAIEYNNPAPVSVCLVPKLESIRGEEEPQMLVIQRNIEPSKGKWAMPSGFVNAMENYEVAAARELGEEIGAVFFDEKDVKLGASFVTPSNQTLVFCFMPALEQDDLLKMQTTSETSDIKFMKLDEINAFPAHKEYAKKLWDQAQQYALEVLQRDAENSNKIKPKF